MGDRRFPPPTKSSKRESRETSNRGRNPNKPAWAPDDYYTGPPGGETPKYGFQKREVEKGGGVIIETTTMGESCEDLIDWLTDQRLTAVILATIGMLFLIMTCAAFFRWPGLLPYFYFIPLPFLLIIRLVYYIRQRWHYLLFDISNLVQMLFFVYMWAAPQNVEFSQIMFGLSFGPLIWAAQFFPRNVCLAPHSGDRMVSMMFAFYPALIMYNVRHQTVHISEWWYRDFLEFTAEPSLGANFAWIFGVAYAIIAVHFILYTLLVYLILRPDRQTRPTSFFILMAKEDSYVTRFIQFFSESFVGQYAVYCFFYLVMAAVSLMLAVFWWENEVACVVLLCFSVIYPVWNGATLYTEVLAPNNFDPSTY